jgi:hypothetical protein
MEPITTEHQRPSAWAVLRSLGAFCSTWFAGSTGARGPTQYGPSTYLAPTEQARREARWTAQAKKSK